MAKELPYFQFEPAQYLTKDISFCSLSAQGLFINICSYYWQRDCKLTKEQLLRRLNYPKELDELISENVIKLDEDDIKVAFLDTQREYIITKSKTNSNNGSKGGRPKKNKANQKPDKTETKANLNRNESESKGIREDKIILDEIKEEKKREVFNSWLSYRKELKKEIKVESTLKKLVEKFNENSIDCCEWVVSNSIENSYQGLFWDNYKQQNKETQTIKKEKGQPYKSNIAL